MIHHLVFSETRKSIRTSTRSAAAASLLALAVVAGGLIACSGDEPANQQRPDGTPPPTDASVSSDIVSTMDAEQGEVVFEVGGDATQPPTTQEPNESDDSTSTDVTAGGSDG